MLVITNNDAPIRDLILMTSTYSCMSVPSLRPESTDSVLLSSACLALHVTIVKLLYVPAQPITTVLVCSPDRLKLTSSLGCQGVFSALPPVSNLCKYITAECARVL